MNDQQLTDRGKFGKYFTQMYNMADDDLNPYQYRLLAHYKRVCGEDNSGVCFESTRTTAKICQMSTGKVSKVRWELVDLGYIEYHEAEGTDAIAIIVLDRMLENVQRYVERNEQRENERKQRNRSPHEQQRSPYEHDRSPDEPEEERSEEEPEKKDSDATAPDAPVPPKPEKPKVSVKPKPSDTTPRRELEKRDALYEDVERIIFEIVATDDDPYNFRGPCGNITKWLRGEIRKFKNEALPASPVVEITPSHLEEFVRRYRKTNGDTSIPTYPPKFANHWSKLMSHTRTVAQPSQNGATHYRDELDKALKQAVHPLTGEALTAAQVSIAYDTLNARYGSHEERLAALPDILERV